MKEMIELEKRRALMISRTRTWQPGFDSGVIFEGSRNLGMR
jgi:hypothetical protein